MDLKSLYKQKILNIFKVYRNMRFIRKIKSVVKNLAFWVCLSLILIIIIDLYFGRSYSTRILNAVISLVSLGKY